MNNNFKHPKTQKYPIFIISKGRPNIKGTAWHLERMGVDYHIVIEPQELEEYSVHNSREKILILPFSNLGVGSGPARNWCWDFSIEKGYERHWILDDNIFGYYKFHKNKRYKIYTGSACFRVIEDFTDRFVNVGLSGHQYYFFAPETEKHNPYRTNLRLMSSILVNNNLPFRWRGKYNEDVDLYIRTLKEGYVTFLVYAYLANKARTGTIKGGNTTEIYNNYKDDSSYKKSKMLLDMHPECVELKEEYGRIHHRVNLDKIINKHGLPAVKNNFPILKKDVKIDFSVNNYGQKMIRNYGKEDQYIDYEFMK